MPNFLESIELVGCFLPLFSGFVRLFELLAARRIFLGALDTFWYFVDAVLDLCFHDLISRLAPTGRSVDLRDSVHCLVSFQCQFGTLRSDFKILYTRISMSRWFEKHIKIRCFLNAVTDHMLWVRLLPCRYLQIHHFKIKCWTHS